VTAAEGPLGDTAEDPLDRGIGAIFSHDDVVREAVSGRLRDRTVASAEVALRARTAFGGFSPSRFSAADRDRVTYLAPGDDLSEAMRKTVTGALEALRESPTGPTIRLALTDELRALVNVDDSGETLGTVELTKLNEYIATRPGSGFTGGGASALAAAKARIEAERILGEIEESECEAAEREAAPSAVGPGNDDTEDSEGDAAAGLVTDQVTRQMTTVTSPEGPLLFNVPQRSDQATRNKAVQTFELRDGPSDVTAYHDFTSLQIAFPHVWTEIFDGRLRSLGEELYQEYVKLKVFAGVDGDDDLISTLDDLGRLMDRVRELSRTVQDDLPVDLRPGTTTPEAPAGSVDLGAVVRTALDPASAVTDGIKDDTIRAIVNPAGAVVDALSALFAGRQQLTWESFPGPLPVGNDVITVSFEENVTPPGTVEIALRNSPEAWWWKGIHFREFDSGQTVVSEFRISNDPRDGDVWSSESYNVLPLYTPQVARSMLEFSKAAFLGVHTGYYVLYELDKKLKDRTRVTFTWTRD